MDKNNHKHTKIYTTRHSLCTLDSISTLINTNCGSLIELFKFVHLLSLLLVFDYFIREFLSISSHLIILTSLYYKSNINLKLLAIIILKLCGVLKSF